MSETITVKLTGRPPVRIAEPAWPIVAEGELDNSRDGLGRHSASRWAFLRVRRHQDGRALVYGGHRTRWSGERDRDAGELLKPDDDLQAAVQRVADALGWEDLAQAVLDDLDPEELA